MADRISNHKTEEFHKIGNHERRRQFRPIEQIAKETEQTNARKREAYETELLTIERGDREKIKNLTYNVVQKATKEIAELKELIGDIGLQKQNIEEMRAFRDKDGRILLGSIKHVTEAFKKYYPSVDETDLENLEANKKNKYNIERMNIDEGLITILKERGFKADIAKGGTDGELRKVGTLHGQWNKEKNNGKGEMEVTFEKYEEHNSNQSNRGGDASSTKSESPIHVALGLDQNDQVLPTSGGTDGEPSQNGPEGITVVAGVAANDAINTGATKDNIVTSDTINPETNDTTNVSEILKDTKDNNISIISNDTDINNASRNTDSAVTPEKLKNTKNTINHNTYENNVIPIIPEATEDTVITVASKNDDSTVIPEKLKNTADHEKNLIIRNNEGIS